jgi:hypothetical protein
MLGIFGGRGTRGTSFGAARISVKLVMRHGRQRQAMAKAFLRNAPRLSKEAKGGEAWRKFPSRSHPSAAASPRRSPSLPIKLKWRGVRGHASLARKENRGQVLSSGGGRQRQVVLPHPVPTGQLIRPWRSGCRGSGRSGWLPAARLADPAGHERLLPLQPVRGLGVRADGRPDHRVRRRAPQTGPADLPATKRGGGAASDGPFSEGTDRPFAARRAGT